MSIFMRFYYTIQAIPTALTPQKRGGWAVWFCLVCVLGRRLFATGASPGVRRPSHAQAPLWAAHPGGISRRLMALRAGNIREGPD